MLEPLVGVKYLLGVLVVELFYGIKNAIRNAICVLVQQFFLPQRQWTFIVPNTVVVVEHVLQHVMMQNVIALNVRAMTLTDTGDVIAS